MNNELSYSAGNPGLTIRAYMESGKINLVLSVADSIVVTPSALRINNNTVLATTYCCNQWTKMITKANIRTNAFITSSDDYYGGAYLSIILPKEFSKEREPLDIDFSDYLTYDGKPVINELITIQF